MAQPPAGQSGNPQIPSSALRPFAAFLVLQSTASASTAAKMLLDFIERREQRRRGTTSVIATGIGGSIDQDMFDEIDAVLFRREVEPSWSTGDSNYVDVRHELVLTLRRGSLLAIHAEDAVRTALLRWVDGRTQPPFRRISSAVMQGAFLGGAARGLSLGGTHRRQATKADTKNLSGRSLGEALSPFEDSTFALRSARADVDDDPSRALRGIVGTTPRNALVWNRPTQSFDDMLAVARDVLRSIDETMAANRGVSRPFPILAEEVDDLANVKGAYDLAIAAPEDLPGIPDSDPDVLDAASQLAQVTLDVIGSSTGPGFDIIAGTAAGSVGTLRARVHVLRRRVHIDIGLGGQPSDPVTLRNILAWLQFQELLTVHYDSGHSVQDGGIYLGEVRDAPFPSWSFADFAGFDITTEKPADDHDEIHANTGEPADTSLFGWVASTFNDGWLTCDDGSGEVADFVHLSSSGELSLIHVKAAKSDSPTRQVSVGAYEVVTAQATKNIGFLNQDTLIARLSEPDKVTRATWQSGIRQQDRTAMLPVLSGRRRSSPFRVVVVQPHVSQAHYASLSRATGGEDRMRLRRLETLLNAARGAAVGVGAEFLVIAQA